MRKLVDNATCMYTKWTPSLKILGVQLNGQQELHKKVAATARNTQRITLY